MVMYEARQNKEKVSHAISPAQKRKQCSGLEKQYMPTVIQRYFTVRCNDSLYNSSISRNILCGINYPNHELYVQDEQKITEANCNTANGLVEFYKKGSKKIGKISYLIVGVRYKQGVSPKREFKYAGLSDDLAKKKVLPTEKSQWDYAELIIQVVSAMETIRKIFLDWVISFGEINPNAKKLNQDYQWVYKHIDKYLNNEMEQSLCLNMIDVFMSILKDIPMPIFDNEGPINDIRSKMEIIKTNIQNLPQNVDGTLSELATLRREMWNNQQAERAPIFLAGCDLMASTLNLAKKDSIYYQARLNDSTDFHYATVIMADNPDYVVMEGFARGRQGFDPNWEFIMHGSWRSINDDFKYYNDLLFSSYLGIQVNNSFSDNRPSINSHIVNNTHDFKDVST